MPLPNQIGPTQVTYRPARDILTKTTGFMSTYDFTLNPYSGCSFGCSYCYAAFFTRDQAQQDNWGLWVNAKQNAAQLIEDLKPGALDGKRIYMSSVTDPYQPLEQRILLTQQILEAMAKHHRPKLVVQTRSPLVTRDIPLFQEIEQRGGRVQVNMTVTTDDEDVRKTFEPGCPSNPARLKAIGQIQKAGIQSCITMTPLLLVRDADAFCDSLLETGVAALHRPDLPLREGGVRRPDQGAGIRHHGGEAGLPGEPVPAQVRETLPGSIPDAEGKTAPAGGGTAGVRPAVLKTPQRGIVQRS